MTVLLVLALTGIAVAAFAAVGHLQRIADAIEAQNNAYGIAEQPVASTSEEAS